MFFAGCSMSDDDDDVVERVGVGDRVPLFEVSVVTASGYDTFSTASLKGRTVIIFFNTSCTDCQRELPRLEAYYRQHCTESDFQLVAISREESAESVAAYWQQHQFTMPYAAQTDRHIYNLFASSVIPRVYVCQDDRVERIYVERLDDSL